MVGGRRSGVAADDSRIPRGSWKPHIPGPTKIPEDSSRFPGIRNSQENPDLDPDLDR